MKFRKGLISAATAAAVLASGVSVQAAEPVVKTENKTTTTTATVEKKGSSSGQTSAKEIQDWIAVATAVIGLLGTLFAFGTKYLKP